MLKYKLLSSVLGERPSLSAVLQVLRGAPDPWGVRAEKRGSEADDATAARKWHHVMVGLGVQFFVHRALRAQLQIHVQMQPSTGAGALRRNVQCIATPYQASEVQSGCTVYFYFTNFLGFRDLYCRST